MRRRALFPAVAIALLASAPVPSGHRTPAQSAGDLVELDVIVVDRGGAPVTGLAAKDFQIKENGRPVDIKTFEAVSGDEERGRHLVLLLDDSSVPMTGTNVVQAMAQIVLSRARRTDEVTVVRLSKDRDEPYGDFETALTRISEYRAGAVPFQGLFTSDRALKVIASVSKQLEAVERKRKLIVCIGGPRVCNVLEPASRGYSIIWPAWVQAVSNAARANVAVCAVMPMPTGTFNPLNGGIVELTGGSGFVNPMNFDKFVDALWREASEYYMLGYWPAAAKRDLQSIDVKVARKDVRVRARRHRG